MIFLNQLCLKLIDLESLTFYIYFKINLKNINFLSAHQSNQEYMKLLILKVYLIRESFYARVAGEINI